MSQRGTRPGLAMLLLALCGLAASRDADLKNDIAGDESQQEEARSQTVLGANETLSDVFEKSVEAYLEEDWDGCVDGFARAIQGYKEYRRIVSICRQKCKHQVEFFEPTFREDIEDMHFYEKKIHETLCLVKCHQNYRNTISPQVLKRLPYHVEEKFLQYTPYEYLHICYYQKKRNQDAANAIFTYLVYHPKDEMSRKNLEFYLDLPDVERDKVVNVEAAPFVTLYHKGVQAYEDEYYEEAVEHFERSLMSFLNSEEQCRLYCEGPFDQGWFPEFTMSISNHFAYCLKCKRYCSLWLENVNGEYRSDLLPSHYHYLQFAYYKLGKLRKTCTAVESYLTFYPADETMLSNKEYYSKLPKVEDDFFKPRQEALSYVKRQEYERRLLRYIVDKFAEVELNFEKPRKEKSAKAKVTEKSAETQEQVKNS